MHETALREIEKLFRAEGGARDITALLGKEHTGVKGQAAIDLLLKERNGHVKGAFHRPEIGSIDVFWGNDKAGMQHIIKQRTARGESPQKILSSLGKVIENGVVSDGKYGNWEIRHGGHVAVIAPELHGRKVNYVLTAFYERKK
jgi:hypothetical protein